MPGFSCHKCFLFTTDCSWLFLHFRGYDAVVQYDAGSNKNTHKHPIPTQDTTPRTRHSTVRAIWTVTHPFLAFSTCYWFLFHLNMFFGTHENSCLRLRTSTAENTKMTIEDGNHNLWIWYGSFPEYATQEVMKSMGLFKTNMNGVESPTIITILAYMRV